MKHPIFPLIFSRSVIGLHAQVPDTRRVRRFSVDLTGGATHQGTQARETTIVTPPEYLSLPRHAEHGLADSWGVRNNQDIAESPPGAIVRHPVLRVPLPSGLPDGITTKPHDYALQYQ